MGLPTEDEREKYNFYMQGEKEDSQTDKKEETMRVAKMKKEIH